MRLRILLTTVCLALLLRGLLLAPGPAAPPLPTQVAPPLEQVWVSAAAIETAVAAAPAPAANAAPVASSAVSRDSASALAPVDSSAVAFGGCRGCVQDLAFGVARERDADIPGVPKPKPGACVSYATRWSKRHQALDGRWGTERRDDCTCCAGVGHEPGDDRLDVERTALMLLAFTGNGHTHRYGTFKRSVNRAQHWLRKQQAPHGWVGHRLDIRGHLIAAFALTELYFMTRDPKLRRDAKRAVRAALTDVVPRAARLPTATIGWLLLALRTAEYAKLAPKGSSAPLVKHTSLAARDPLGLAVAILASAMSGKKASDPTVVAAGRRLTTRLPAWEVGRVDMERWYFATYAAFQLDGAVWQTWNAAMQRALLPSMRSGGCADGSWDPIGRQGARGGRAWTYALGALTLEIYYRWERAKQSD